MEQQLKLARFIANLLDNRFEIFGRRFGLNGLLGIIPGVGDLIPTLLSFQLVIIALRMRIPKIIILRILWNVIFNFLIGLVPVVGDYIDFFNHANLKNLKLIEKYSDKIIEGEIVR